jgi:hypothetical protein
MKKYTKGTGGGSGAPEERYTVPRDVFWAISENPILTKP